MRKFVLTLAGLFLMGTLAGTVLAQANPALSTADKIAIGYMEQKKADAQKQYNDAQQGEATVLREWYALHPGYYVNPQSFAVEKTPAPPAAPSRPASKEVKK